MTAAALLDWSARVRALLDELPALLGEPAANDPTAETVDAWVERWWTERATRIRRTDHERERYARWIRPHVGKLPIATLSRANVEAWIEFVEGRVAAGELRSSTAWRLWTVLRAILRDAAQARVRALRVRSDNLALGLRGPERGTSRASTFLYPSEFMRLVSCPRVPLAHRRLYAVAVYLYPRAGELRALEWADLDLPSGRIHIHRSESHGELGATKTGEDRQFVAEPRILPLLRAMRRRAKGERVFPGLTRELSATLRAHLRRSGCARADLYADDDGRRPLTFHDLRATGITWLAMRGESGPNIMERVGHLHLTTTERYIRRGRLLARASGERVFPPLPPGLLRG